MTQNKKSPALRRLTLPAVAVQRLRRAGIFCTPGITIEFQQTSKRHVLRGRESGGAVKEFGHYVTFCGDGGERLPWFVRPDSLTANGDHAIVIAPTLVSIEALRVEHTYELLIARHELRAEKEGARPRIWSRVVFRGWQGQLPLDLVEKDRSVAGQIAPEFFTRAGEPRQLPARFVDGVHAVTAAVSCRMCSHAHFLVDPARRPQQQPESQRGDQMEGSTDKDQETAVAAIG
ncbi:MAG: hypothetical protein U0Q18_32595 [Bryobacteraceae bacterium]